MTKFLNCTPHAIVVGDITIEPSGIVPRVQEADEPNFCRVDLPAGMTARKPAKGEVAGLPEAEWGTLYIVSAMVRELVPNRKDVISPDTGPTAIRNDKGHIIAVKGFCFN